MTAGTVVAQPGGQAASDHTCFKGSTIRLPLEQCRHHRGLTYDVAPLVHSYMSGILLAEENGQIIYWKDGKRLPSPAYATDERFGPEDPHSHLDVKHYGNISDLNYRTASPTVIRLLGLYSAEDNPVFLDAGMGFGLGSYTVKRAHPHVQTEGVGLTPTNPFVSLINGDISQMEQLLAQLYQSDRENLTDEDNTRIQRILSSNRFPISALLEFEERFGLSFFEKPSRTAYIDRQHIGRFYQDISLPEGRYSFISDSEGAINYNLSNLHMHAAGVAGIEKAVRLLREDGILFFQWQPHCRELGGLPKILQGYRQAGDLIVTSNTDAGPCMFARKASPFTAALVSRYGGQQKDGFFRIQTATNLAELVSTVC